MDAMARGDVDTSVALDTTGDFYDGTRVTSLAELVTTLLKRPQPLMRNFAENLMAYGLGRASLAAPPSQTGVAHWWPAAAAAVALAVGLTAIESQAALLGIDFTSTANGGQTAMLPTETAGVVPQQFWNSVAPNTTNTPLLLSTGVASGAFVTVNNANLKVSDQLMSEGFLVRSFTA